jgi:hypothetical protein
MSRRAELYAELSKIMAWPYDGTNFVGLRQWKAQFNDALESKLFSTSRIKSFQESEFLELLNSAPAGARYRIRRRLLTADDKPKGKWPASLAEWFLKWEKSKEAAQQEQRNLVEKIRQGAGTDDDKKRLEQVKKEAKVNTGGVSLLEMLEKFMRNPSASDDTLIQSILDKIKFEVPVLVVKDVSGSMMGLPDKIATFLTTVTMLKNPDTECDNMCIVFGINCDVITDKSTGTIQQNRFMQGQSIAIPQLIDRTKSFSKNFETISNATRNRNEGTNFDSVARKIEHWIKSAENVAELEYRKEWLNRYPVILVVSDGDMNDSYNAAQSLQVFQQTMTR